MQGQGHEISITFMCLRKLWVSYALMVLLIIRFVHMIYDLCRIQIISDGCFIVR